MSKILTGTVILIILVSIMSWGDKELNHQPAIIEPDLLIWYRIEWASTTGAYGHGKRMFTYEQAFDIAIREGSHGGYLTHWVG